MKSFQDRMIDEFERIAEAEGCELVHTRDWVNTGELLAQKGFGNTVARVYYHFQIGHNKLLFNDRTMIDASEHDDVKVRAALDKWRELIRVGVNPARLSDADELKARQLNQMAAETWRAEGKLR